METINGYELTNLDIVLPMKIDGKIKHINMDLYAKCIVVNGLPYIGHFVTPRDNSLLEKEFIEIDLANYLLWNTEIFDEYVLEDGIYVQNVGIRIFRNHKLFYEKVYVDGKMAKSNLDNIMSRLQDTNQIIDYRVKDFEKPLLGKTLMVNNVKITIIKYFHGKNEFEVSYGKNKENTILSALAIK